jgi:uncharacterized protein YlxW (UPF0749 family)
MIMDCVTCGFGLPWQEYEEHVIVSQARDVAKKETEVVRVEDQDLEYITNRTIQEKKYLLKEVTILTQERDESMKERDESMEEVNKLKKEMECLRNALGGQVEDRDLLDTVFEW